MALNALFQLPNSCNNQVLFYQLMIPKLKIWGKTQQESTQRSKSNWKKI